MIRLRQFAPRVGFDNFVCKIGYLPTTLIFKSSAPQAGLGPATSSLTAKRSTIELLRSTTLKLSYRGLLKNKVIIALKTSIFNAESFI